MDDKVGLEIARKIDSSAACILIVLIFLTWGTCSGARSLNRIANALENNEAPATEQAPARMTGHGM